MNLSQSVDVMTVFPISMDNRHFDMFSKQKKFKTPQICLAIPFAFLFAIHIDWNDRKLKEIIPTAHKRINFPTAHEEIKASDFAKSNHTHSYFYNTPSLNLACQAKDFSIEQKVKIKRLQGFTQHAREYIWSFL